MNGLAFQKMHGLGNDFVILDGRTEKLDLTPEGVRRIADRRRGIGCDQLIVLEPSARADLFMRIYNPDGGEAEACGNATRCIARLLHEEGAEHSVHIETVAGVLDAAIDGDGQYAIDMGAPRFDWREIPLAEARDTLHLGIEAGPLVDPVAVNIGNPHAVFFVGSADEVPLDRLGPELEHHPLFPERANIEAAEVRDRRTIRLRVWERGAGLTLACGSGACAALVAAVRRGLAEREADVILDGGPLHISWKEEGRVVMTGPASHSFQGTLSPELLGISP